MKACFHRFHGLCPLYDHNPEANEDYDHKSDASKADDHKTDATKDDDNLVEGFEQRRRYPGWPGRR